MSKFFKAASANFLSSYTRFTCRSSILTAIAPEKGASEEHLQKVLNRLDLASDKAFVKAVERRCLIDEGDPDAIFYEANKAKYSSSFEEQHPELIPVITNFWLSETQVCNKINETHAAFIRLAFIEWYRTLQTSPHH